MDFLFALLQVLVRFMVVSVSVFSILQFHALSSQKLKIRLFLGLYFLTVIYICIGIYIGFVAAIFPHIFKEIEIGFLIKELAFSALTSINPLTPTIPIPGQSFLMFFFKTVPLLLGICSVNFVFPFKAIPSKRVPFAFVEGILSI